MSDTMRVQLLDAICDVSMHLERAMTIHGDVADDYFAAHDTKKNDHLPFIINQFDANRIRSEIVENELDELKRSLDVVRSMAMTA